MAQSRITIIPTAAILDERLSPVQLKVLLAIGSFTSKDRAAFPKQKTIAEMLGLSRETINRALSALKQYGYVQSQHQFRQDGGQKENLYWVKLDPSEHPPCDAGVTPPVTIEDHTPCDATGSHLRTSNRNLYTDTEVSVLTENPEQPSKKRSGRVRGPSRKTALPESWYPGPAVLAYASQMKFTREEINHETDQFRASAVANGRRYADWDAAFRTWLGNSAKWRDERAAKGNHRAQTGSQSGGSSMLAAGLRAVADIRGYGKPVPGERGMGTGDVIEGETF